MAMSQKVLSFDPDDPEPLVGVAQVLAERTPRHDLDKDQKIGRGRKNCAARAGHGGHRRSSSGYPPEHWPAFKGFLKSELTRF